MTEPGVLQVRAPGLNFYVLRDAQGLYLIDAGFIGGRYLLRRALRDAGWDGERILGIIVTHGHLDHILNVAAIAQETGAWVAAPRLDAAQYEGRARYCGWARVTGVLEALGRRVLPFGSFLPDRWVDDGDLIEVWDGLRASHLPGHTVGHTGYYCEARRLLFCADLFASYGERSHYPPAIFNSAPELMRGSVEKALALTLDGMLPNHCDGATAAVHLQRLRRLL